MEPTQGMGGRCSSDFSEPEKGPQDGARAQGSLRIC